jgi:23S rRNA (cytidine1920-2'-O)/16S rRNA (cytidine1409-2'-O)-methyltransferase
MAKKTRLDALLVERGLAADLKEAQALVLAGQVLQGDTLLSLPAQLFAPEAALRVRGRKDFVSRAGGKLEAALQQSGISVEGLACLDLGASTGGFTDCLLKRGAAKVYAVDSGYHQLDYRLTQDPRVVSWESKDGLTLKPSDFESAPAFACADLSFMSLKPMLPVIAGLLAPGGRWVLLVKPQFEAAPGQVGEGGIVTDDEVRRRTLDEVESAAIAAALRPQGSLASPVLGTKGNREWLLWGGT